MSQSARNDPEGYRQREGEHKPYEPVKATKPKATDGDRELALLRAEVESLRADKERLDWLLGTDGSAWHYWEMEYGREVERRHIDAATSARAAVAALSR